MKIVVSKYPEIKPSEAGSPEMKERAMLFDKETGSYMIGETGKIIRTQELIQAACPPSLEQMVEQMTVPPRIVFEEAAELPVVDRTMDDFDFLAAKAVLDHVQSKYDDLPADIKSNFGNSFGTWLKAIEDGSYQTYLDSLSKPTGGDDNA